MFCAYILLWKLQKLPRNHCMPFQMQDGQYTFREAHNLADFRVESCHSRRTLGRDARFKFQMLLARKTQESAFTLYMKTDAERLKWKKALDEAM